LLLPARRCRMHWARPCPPAASMAVRSSFASDAKPRSVRAEATSCEMFRPASGILIPGVIHSTDLDAELGPDLLRRVFPPVLAAMNVETLLPPGRSCRASSPLRAVRPRPHHPACNKTVARPTANAVPNRLR
jgi:hypothetical protein